jgi:hypothetical protein
MVHLYIQLYSKTGNKIPLDVNPLDTMAEIKERLSFIDANVPIKRLRLVYKRVVLENDKTVHDYELDKDVFTGAILLLKDIEIKVIPNKGGEFELVVHPTNSIDRLKHRIGEFI